MAALDPSARPVEGASERTWWASGPWFRKFVPVWFALTLFLLGYLVLVSEDVPTGTMISAVINPVVAASLWTTVRQRTLAGPDGLTVVRALRTRSLPWEEVSWIGGGSTGRWPIQARAGLADGSTVSLGGVRTSDVKELESLRNEHLPGSAR